MERKFILSCCSTVDLPYSYMQSRDIPVLFYTYVVDGQEYVDDMGRDPEALPRFYRFLEAGKLPQTSQINVGTYLDFFEAQLEKGDLLHIAFTSGQSGSVHNAVAAAKLLQEKYPDKKLVVIDSLCSSSGYGLLVDAAADLRGQRRHAGGDGSVGAGKPQQGPPPVLLLQHDPVPPHRPCLRRSGHGGHHHEHLPHHAAG